MWIFNSPKNYMEMIEKISKSTFVVLLFLLYALTCINEEFLSFLKKISFGAEYKFIGITLNLALFYLPLLMGIFEHMFKIHDKISDLFGIRKRYDKNCIVLEILKYIEVDNNINSLSDKQIKNIMSIVFYRYASSTNPIIDTHYIYLALNEWCWYWIVLDTTDLILFIGGIFLFFNLNWINFWFILSVLTLLFILMHLLKLQVKQYSKSEVYLIFQDKKRKENIKKEIGDALSS